MGARIEGPLYRDIYALHMWRRNLRNVDVAMGDGTWVSVEEGTHMPENAGIEIPGDIFEEVFQAFLEYKGFKAHDPTEVKVLREWLDVERNRVNSCLKDAMKKLIE